MKKTLVLTSICFAFATAWAAEPIQNPLIDYKGFQKIVIESAGEREAHRLTEAQFITAMTGTNTVLLDARTAMRYDQRHIRGAVNLAFTEFTADSLAKVIPTQDAKILIYCNNNFLGSPIAFAGKATSASLNVSTYTALKSYGYTNIYELGPLLEVHQTAIPFVGTEVK